MNEITYITALVAACFLIGFFTGQSRKNDKIMEARFNAEERGYNRGMIDQQIATAKVYVLHRKRKGIK